MTLAGLEELALPIAASRQAPAGPVTAGFYQDAAYDHFLIFDSAEAAALYGDFLASVVEGAPRIGP